MQTLRSTVYIPLAELTHQSGQLLEVYAENQVFGETVLDKKAIDKNWNFVAAPLRDAGLYNEGLQVVSAIRKLDLKTSRWAIYQCFKKYAWLDNQRLHVGNQHFENCEGNSAQLGLAIALLLNASNSSIRYAVATGKLSSDRHADFDVAIEAVGSVPEKLRLLIEKRKTDALPDMPLYCFTPKYYNKEGELKTVLDLPEVKQLAALNIEVKPIEWLSEAVKILKAKKTRYLKQDKWLVGSFGVFVSLILAFALYCAWLFYPIPVTLLPGKNLSEPFLVCANRDYTKVSYYNLERDANMPIMPLFSNENSEYNFGIGWKLKAEATPFSKRYYLGFIHLGEQTGYKLINKQPNSAEEIIVTGSQILQWYWPMQEESTKEQDNMLIVVVQRTPILADKLNQAFAERFSATKRLNILQARDFLLPKFPGNYVFSYKSILGDSPCIKSSL